MSSEIDRPPVMSIHSLACFSVQQNDPALDSTEMKNTLVENERTAVMKTQQVGSEIDGRIAQLAHFALDLGGILSDLS